MKQVFLIQAHKDLAQLNALVRQLRDDDFIIYVNLDRKCALDPAAVDPGARLVRERIDVHWGGFSQVQATLNALREIVAAVPAFDKVLFLSAQDFPLLSNARLKQELAALAGQELLDVVQIGPQGWNVPFRYQYFSHEGSGAPRRLLDSLANRLLRATGRKRHLPARLQPWGGSSWWALSRACIVELLARLEREPAIIRFFRSVQCPDEMFFQTLVMNSRFRERVLSRNFRYIQWPEQGARNPEVLAEHDLERILASGAHFCRKLDSVRSAGLLARLRELLGSPAIP